MNLDFEKGQGLIPVIIQHYSTLQVLMLGYMNEEAFIQTKNEGRETFYSRSKNRLWTKGETSGNYLHVIDYKADCDNDTLLIRVNPDGPVCHTGSVSCFNEETGKGFIYELEQVIKQRIDGNVPESYTNKLFRKGINKIAQKVGEEAVELVIESKDDSIELFSNEAADLLYHFLILLKAKGLTFADIEKVLAGRHKG